MREELINEIRCYFRVIRLMLADDDRQDLVLKSKLMGLNNLRTHQIKLDRLENVLLKAAEVADVENGAGTINYSLELARVFFSLYEDVDVQHFQRERKALKKLTLKHREQLLQEFDEFRTNRFKEARTRALSLSVIALMIYLFNRDDYPSNFALNLVMYMGAVFFAISTAVSFYQYPQILLKFNLINEVNIEVLEVLADFESKGSVSMFFGGARAPESQDVAAQVGMVNANDYSDEETTRCDVA